MLISQYHSRCSYHHNHREQEQTLAQTHDIQGSTWQSSLNNWLKNWSHNNKMHSFGLETILGQPVTFGYILLGHGEFEAVCVCYLGWYQTSKRLLKTSVFLGKWVDYKGPYVYSGRRPLTSCRPDLMQARRALVDPRGPILVMVVSVLDPGGMVILEGVVVVILGRGVVVRSKPDGDWSRPLGTAACTDALHCTWATTLSICFALHQRYIW